MAIPNVSRSMRSLGVSSWQNFIRHLRKLKPEDILENYRRFYIWLLILG